ncbi:DUF6402 family protein [Klebsiella variicola]|uniref:DUF6402 family protein n=1 Tax=Klebsiella variicola TaxID=244366 RepID=UPI003C6D5599
MIFIRLFRGSCTYLLRICTCFNHDFRLWQKKHGTGGDYIILSDVLWAKVEESDKVIFL